MLGRRLGLGGEKGAAEVVSDRRAEGACRGRGWTGPGLDGRGALEEVPWPQVGWRQRLWEARVGKDRAGRGGDGLACGLSSGRRGSPWGSGEGSRQVPGPRRGPHLGGVLWEATGRSPSRCTVSLSLEGPMPSPWTPWRGWSARQSEPPAPRGALRPGRRAGAWAERGGRRPGTSLSWQCLGGCSGRVSGSCGGRLDGERRREAWAWAAVAVSWPRR